MSADAADGLPGKLEGTGRACAGALYVKSNVVEWNSTYSICKPTRYEILEKSLDGKSPNVVFLLKNPGSPCRFKVVEVERASRYNWNVNGYPSLEGFRKRALPGWSHSALPGRQVLSCLMVDAS